MKHKIEYLSHIPIKCKKHPFRKYRCKEFYPLSDKDYWKCHLEANKKVKEVYGEEGFNKLRYYFFKYYPLEAMGKNTKTGILEISKLLPPELRKIMILHERTESDCLIRKHKEK